MIMAKGLESKLNLYPWVIPFIYKMEQENNNNQWIAEQVGKEAKKRGYDFTVTGALIGRFKRDLIRNAPYEPTTQDINDIMLNLKRRVADEIRIMGNGIRSREHSIKNIEGILNRFRNKYYRDKDEELTKQFDVPKFMIWLSNHLCLDLSPFLHFGHFTDI